MTTIQNEETNVNKKDHGALMKKMAEVIKKTGNVQKKGVNKDQNYKFAQHWDIIEELRKHIADEGLFILPKPESYETAEIVSRSGTKGAMITMKMDFEITDTATGYSISVKWFGQGMDYGDKAMYKSYTGALKYFLLDTFMISTGDDPENDSHEEKPAPQSSAVPAKKPSTVTPAKPAAPAAAPAEKMATSIQLGNIRKLLKKKGKDEEIILDSMRLKSLEALTLTQATGVINKLTTLPDFKGEEVNVDEVAKGIEETKKKEEPIDPNKQPAEKFMIAWVTHHKDELLNEGLVTQTDIDQVEFMNVGTYKRIFDTHKNLSGIAKK